MSKALGTKKVKYDTTPTKNLVNFLNSYDTSSTDKTLSNLTNYAASASNSLADTLGGYNFGVDASEEARNQAQNATYNAYMDRLRPEFERQTADYATMLQNKGLPVGSEAYERAMRDLQDRQNEATNQAAYQSVLAGQQAYSQDLQNQIAAGNFGNTAQQAYINQLLSALQGSSSGYDVAMDKYAAQSNQAAQQYAARQQAANNKLALTNSLIGGASSAGGMASAAMLSDERVKDNIKPVGKLDNGLTVYVFNYKGDPTKQIGLIAQEVLKVKPEAVIEGEDGFLRVNYEKATEA